MKAAVLYEMIFKNVELQTIKTVIEDMSVMVADDVDQTIYEMTGADDPLHISTTDNDENKFTAIKAKKATIKFLNENAINYQTFARGEDDRFRVTITCNDLVIFKGFLEQSDIQEPFLFQENQEVTLVAIDGLAYLKDIPLTDFDELTPRGQFRLIDYLTYCLSKTGLSLNINIVDNLREQDNPGTWQNQINFINSTSRLSTFFSDSIFYKAGHQIRITGSASNNTTFTIVSIISPGIIQVSPAPTDELAGPTVTVEDITDAGNLYAVCYLDSKTFEDQIGTCHDCETVIKKILGEDCFITQWKGEWWIFRIKEFRNDFSGYVTRFDSTGTLISSFETINFEKAIGLQRLSGTTPIPFTGVPDATSYFSNESTNRTFDRPIKSGELDYNYDIPLELICNIDFSRGDFIADLPDEVIESTTYKAKSFSVECWVYEKNVPAVTQDSTSYIKKLFFNDYEKERYLHMEATAVDAFYYQICVDLIPMSKGDKFSIGVSVRYSTDLGGGSGHFILSQIWVRLYGDDGSFWNLYLPGGTGTSDPVPKWVVSNSSWSIGQRFVQLEGESSQVDFREWNDCSGEAAPLPVSGNIEILLINAFQSSSQTKEFSSLTMEYIPLINGSYQKYRGQSNTTTQTGNYKSKIKEQVFIADSPKKIFKGALHKFNGIAYVLVDRFYEGQEFLYPSDGLNNLYPFGQLQDRSVFNQYRNGNEVLQMTSQGLDSASTEDGECGALDIIHRYFNRDLEPATNQQVFQLVTIDQNWKLCEVKGTLIKTFDNTIGFILTDDFQFKYIS